MQRILSAPETWRAPLAIVWPHLSDPAGSIAALLASGNAAAHTVGINAILANQTPSESARSLVSILGNRVLDLLPTLMANNEQALAQEVVHTASESQHNSPQSAVDFYHAGLGYHALARHGEALEALEQAWDESHQLAARAADQLACVAQAEGDQVIELEAAGQALEVYPSTSRRARYARALLQTGRAEDARHLLPERDPAPEDKIVLASVLAHSGDRPNARKAALSAHQALCAGHPIDTPWLVDLTDTLEKLGRTSEALSSATELLWREPTSVNVRVRLARLLRKSNRSTGAIEQARLALSLEPDSVSVRACLARSLQASGEADAALPYWMSLASEAPSFEPELISCALDSGEVDMALERAETYFAQQPNSPEAAVLLANAKRADGDIETAIEILEQVIDVGSTTAETWIELATCRAQLDEHAYSATLAAGVQALPHSPQIHFKYAQHLRENGEYNQALSHLKEAVDAAPDQPSFNNAYGSLLLQLGHLEQSLPYLEEAVAREPGSWRVKAQLAEAYEQLGRLENAADILLDLPEDSETELHIKAGKILTNAGLEIGPEYAGAALPHLERAEQLQADEPLLGLWMAQALEQISQYKQALGRYQEFIHEHPGCDQESQVAALLGQGRAAIALGETAMAVSMLEQAREDRPGSPGILMLLAKAYREENLPQQALECAQAAVDVDPENPSALRTLAEIEAARKSWKNAVEATRRWAAIEPANIDAWLSLADCSLHAELESSFRDAAAKALWLSRSSSSDLIRTASKLKEHGAVSAAKRAVCRAAKQAQSMPFATLERLAQVAADLELYEDASKVWIELSAQAPEDPCILAKSADALWKAQRRQDAIAHWQKAVDQDRENPALHAQLAKALVAEGKRQDGLELYMKAVELDPEDAEIALETGRAFARHGTKEEAIAYLHKAAELNPTDLESQLALAQTRLELGRLESAQEVLERIVRQTNPPAKAHAMAAIANLGLGRASEAMGHLKKAESYREKSYSDAIWLARAEMYSGNWPLAFECYRQCLNNDDDSSLKMEAVKAFLKILDAQWLYADYAKAYAHAPASRLDLNQVKENIDLLLEKFEREADPDAVIPVLNNWRGIHNPDVIETAMQGLSEATTSHLSTEFVHAKAIAHLKCAQPEKALQALQIRSNAPNPNAWDRLLTGIAHNMQGERDRARAAFEAAGHDSPIVRPLAWILKGRAWIADGDVVQGIQVMSEALVAWPDESAWHVELGELYAAEGKFDAALPHYQKAVELDADNPKAALKLARILRKTGQLHEAEAIYARVIQARPSEGEIWKEAAQISLDIGKPEQAQNWFERAQTLAPSDAQCIIGAAKAAMELGDQRKAMELSEKAARTSPDDLQVLLGIGEIQTRQGKYERALEVYDRALGLSDDPLTVQISRAKVLTQIGRPGQAVGDLRLSLERAPQDHRLWAALAEACEADDEIEYALDAASKALRLSPRDPAYQILVGRLARKHGQLDIALDQIAQAKSTLPTSPHVQYELGRIYEERRQYSQALAAFQEALKLDPENRDAYFHAGLVLKQLKAYQDAGRMFENVVTRQPRDPEALHQLAAVRALQLVHGGMPQTAVTS
jgi:tetratricopeptide (TPR) repeat protein